MSATASGNPVRAYAPHQHLPLAGYTGLMVGFATAFGVATWIVRRWGRPLELADTFLVGVSAHKLGRIIAKDFVTAPLRAPFTRRVELEGGGEVHDEPRDDSVSRSLGDLITCPYCLGPWIAVGLSTLSGVRPGGTRFALSCLTSVAISDYLHQGYARLNEDRKLVQSRRRSAEQDERAAGAGTEDAEGTPQLASRRESSRGSRAGSGGGVAFRPGSQK